MGTWGKWELSNETEDRLNEICLKLNNDNSFGTSEDWLTLLGCGSSSSREMEVDSPKENVILHTIKAALVSSTVVSEAIWTGTSVNALSRVLLSVNELLNEFEFCNFCKNVASWKEDILVEHSLRLVVLPKLKEFTEATGCIIFSIKELAQSKPIKFCEYVLIPLFMDNTVEFTDVELFSGVFSVLPIAQKDLLMLTFTKKNEFLESDWLLLSGLLKDLSQNALQNLLICTQKFSKKFTESQVFGRFLVSFCRISNFNQKENILREAVKGHKTLLKVQALKYLESG